jgi:hypothetical protein
MKKFVLWVVCLLLSTLGFADTPRASLTTVKKTHHHAQHHRAHKAAKHKAPKHKYHSV